MSSTPVCAVRVAAQSPVTCIAETRIFLHSVRLEVVDAEALIDTTTEYWSTWRGDPKHSAFMTFLRSVEFEQILLGAGFGS